MTDASRAPRGAAAAAAGFRTGTWYGWPATGIRWHSGCWSNGTSRWCGRGPACGANPSDVDDIVQESFLRAFIALDQLRDPDRFAGWLAGVVLNVCRGLRRRDEPALLPDWPEPLHPAAADGLPSAEDLDRAEALRAAVAGLPAGQRRAVTLHYYAGLPPAQIAEPAGAARASLHKARLRLRAYLTEHRPDLVPAASRRTRMTTVRIARVERRVPPGPVPIGRPTDVAVLADDAGRRELPVWLLADDGDRLSGTAGPPAGGRGPAAAAAARTADELAGRLLRAAGASVTGVDIDELGPGSPWPGSGSPVPRGPGTSRPASATASPSPRRQARRSGCPTRCWSSWRCRPGDQPAGDAAGLHRGRPAS